MDVKEHFYRDDPSVGHADVRTTLGDVDYFLVGNGHIQAAVQLCTTAPGTPLGLLVMHPDKLTPKREALTLDAERGLQPTVLTIRSARREYAPAAANVEARWTDVRGLPAVEAVWHDGELSVEELFYCPDRHSPHLIREVRVSTSSTDGLAVTLRLGPDDQPLTRDARVAPDELARAWAVYELSASGNGSQLVTSWCDQAPDTTEGGGWWSGMARFTCSNADLDHLFRAASYQLPAAVSATGILDGSIWQYNREWVRDQAAVSVALAAMGATDLARTMLQRLLGRFASDEGDTVDSGERRPPAEAELDQNGSLLAALESYVNWTGDLALVNDQWKRVTALAEFPLRDTFRHAESGLLVNRREYWERHAVHGIEEGMELAYQLHVAIGLESAARLARLLEHGERAKRWEAEGKRIKDAMLGDARYGLVEEGRLIKRRQVSGAVQAEALPSPQAGLPDGVPLLADGPHRLDPDTSTALPIALEFVDPASDLARRTLEQIEQLWNQEWTGGGYGRYHVSSEADSPGPWPFPSLFVARAYFEAGNDEKVWRTLNWLAGRQEQAEQTDHEARYAAAAPWPPRPPARLPGSRAGSWFEFYGPRPVPPYPQVGLIPWTWAELLTLFIHHLLGVRPSWNELRLRPRLLAGLTSAEAALQVRGHRLHLRLRQAKPGEAPSIRAGTAQFPYTADGIHLPWPKEDLSVEVVERRRQP